MSRMHLYTVAISDKALAALSALTERHGIEAEPLLCCCAESMLSAMTTEPELEAGYVERARFLQAGGESEAIFWGGEEVPL